MLYQPPNQRESKKQHFHKVRASPQMQYGNIWKKSKNIVKLFWDELSYNILFDIHSLGYWLRLQIIDNSRTRWWIRVQAGTMLRIMSIQTRDNKTEVFESEMKHTSLPVSSRSFRALIISRNCASFTKLSDVTTGSSSSNSSLGRFGCCRSGAKRTDRVLSTAFSISCR